MVPARTNAQPAFGCYLGGHDALSRDAGAHFTGIVVLTLRGTRIAGVTPFLDRGLAPALGLPATTP